MPPDPGRRTCDVSVVIVSLNTRDLLAACLRSVFASAGVAFEVFVVDNGSTDHSALMVARDFPTVHLICNPDNRGFAAANNVAIWNAVGRYVLLLNPDTEIEPDTLMQMASFMDSHSDAGICGPCIDFPDGRFQSCGYRFPTLWSEIRQSKNLDRIVRAMVGVDPPQMLQATPFPTDWVDGACLLIRRQAISDVGLLDEQYFLYAEELDWCFRVKKAGWGIFALPAVGIIHHQGQSSAQMSDFSLGLLVETRLRYYRKNHGLPSALITSLFYIAAAVRQLNRNRAKQLVKLRATLRWWRSLLPA